MTPTRYSARCHCGAVRFSFHAAPITAGARCNCSFCIRRGAVLSTEYLALDSLEGREALTLYLWGDKLLNHWFCATCGVYAFGEPVERPGRYRLNLGCVEGVDPLALPITVLDGRAL